MPQAPPSLPCSIEAEEAITGGLLLSAKPWCDYHIANPDQLWKAPCYALIGTPAQWVPIRPPPCGDRPPIRRVAAIVLPRDFYHPALRAIYEAMLDLDHQSRPIDIITVGEQMRAAGTIVRLRAHGGEAFLGELASKVVTVENITYHAELVKQKAEARGLVMLGKDLATRAAVEEPSKLVAELQKSLVVSVPQTYLSVEASEYSDIYDEPAPALLPSCLEPISDALGGGYQSHAYYVVNGPTKHGKSSMGLQEARHKLELGWPVLVVSVEMRRREILSRLCSQRLPVAHQEINRHYWDGTHDEDIRRGLGAAARVRILEFRRGKGRGVTVRLQDIFDDVKRLSDATGHSPFVVLDYTQRLLSRIDGGQHDPRVAIGMLSDALAEATRDLGACFFVLSAIPRRLYGERSTDMQDDELMGASAEGGGVEYDAAAVLFLRKVGKLLPDRRSRAIVRITGQRYAAHSGEPIRLIFDGAHNLFEPDVSAAEEDPVPKEILELLAKPVHRGGLTATDLYKTLQKQHGRRKQQVLAVLKELVDSEQVWCSGRPGSRGAVYCHAQYAPKERQPSLLSPQG